MKTESNPACSASTAKSASSESRNAVVEAKKSGVSEAQLADVLALQRKAQWRLDFVAAENSMGFHAPQETARVLAEAIDYARQGQLAASTRSPGARPASR